MTTLTSFEIEAIRLHAVNDITRDIAANGILLTHDQADDLGEETIAWIGGRLGLNVRTTDAGVECTPPRHYSGEEARRDGVEIHDEI